jgi:hypothetical protein
MESADVEAHGDVFGKTETRAIRRARDLFCARVSAFHWR